MHKLIYITLMFLASLMLSCDKSADVTSSLSVSPEPVELTIKLEGGLEFKTPIQLVTSSKGARSFSSNTAAERKFASNISFNYIGKIDLEDVYAPNAPLRGDLIAFLITQFDPELKETVYSKVEYVIYTGKSEEVFNDRGIHVSIKKQSEQVAASDR